MSEEIIKVLERFKNNEIQRDKLERDSRCGGWKIGDVYKHLELNNAIEHILSDYRRVLKENEKLTYARNWYFEHTVGKICTPEMLDKILRNDYILKQKIKDIIDRIDYDIKKTKEIISKNTNIYASYRKNDYQIVRLRAMNTKSLDIKKRLQKLLESEE